MSGTRAARGPKLAEGAALPDGIIPTPASRGTTTLYFRSSSRVTDEPILVLNGEGTGLINNVVEISAAAPEYAPSGEHLIAVSIVGVPDEDDDQLTQIVLGQLHDWFGPSVDDWSLLRIYRIRHALPDQTAGTLEPARRSVRIHPGLYVCGDHRDQASIDGALTSGFRAAQAVMEDLHRGLT